MHGFVQFVLGLFLLAWLALAKAWGWLTGARGVAAVSEHNNCTRCNAGMPSFRVNSLCEECFAEESDQYDAEADRECPHCIDGYQREGDGPDEFAVRCEHCDGTGWC